MATTISKLIDLDSGFGGTMLDGATMAVYTSLSDAENVWRRAMDSCACFVFQTFEWNATWCDTIGRTQMSSEFIVHIASSDGRTLLILPLAISRHRNLHVLEFLGGTLTDYNAPLIDTEFARKIDAHAFRRLWRVVLTRLPAVDAVWLKRMPKTIDGVRNPMTDLPRMRHTDDAFAAVLPTSFKEFVATRSTQFFSQIRRHRRRLEKRGTVEISFPVENDQRIEVVRVLAQQKSTWLRNNGHVNIFEQPATREFYERLTNRPFQAGQILVACLRVGDQIAATMWGAVFGRRYYFLQPSYAEEWRHYSAGRILTESVLQRCIDQGEVRVFDLTIGDEGFKRTWSDHSLALHEYVEARSLKGIAFATYRRLRSALRSNKHIRAMGRALLAKMRARGRGETIRSPAGAS